MWAENVAVPRPGTSWWAFVGWLLLGAGIGVGLGLGALLWLGVAIVLVVLGGFLVVRQGPRPAQLGIVSGLGALPLTIAWLNRHGPGEYCSGGVSGTSGCIAQAAWWPFALVGLVAVVVGLVAFRRMRRAPRLIDPPRAR